MRIQQRLLILCLAFTVAVLNAADNSGVGASGKTPSEAELLRSQIALQQQQIEQLRLTLQAQQRVLDGLAQRADAIAQQPVVPAAAAVVATGEVAPVALQASVAQASALIGPPAPPPDATSAPEPVRVASLRAPDLQAPPVAKPLLSLATLRTLFGVPGVAAQAAAATPASVTAATGVSLAILPSPQAPIPASHEAEHAEVRQPKKWYERYSFKGYTQIRHNRLVQTNNELICAQCDGSTANNNNFIIRRARFVLSGEISDQVSMYIQPDFAVTNGALHFGQFRDAYFDIAIDKKKEFRFRAGLSKVPYTFENLQSSQNRLHLDRNDATNSSFANERDLGIFFYWAPAHIRARFNELTTKGLKGSGDYGVIGTGLYNGQILNVAEANNDLHYSFRATYPWKLRNGQFIEASLQGYTGKYTVGTRTAATRGNPGFLYNDRRAAASLVIYPQPFGLQTEWNLGTGPEYNRLTRFIDQKNLRGGYVQLMYMKRWENGMIMTPFYKYTNYAGGKKQEIDARHYVVRDHDLGVEWQPNHTFEITLIYSKGFRIFEDAARPNWRQSGHQLRTQLQINY